jgi:hypothetical protein
MAEAQTTPGSDTRLTDLDDIDSFSASEAHLEPVAVQRIFDVDALSAPIPALPPPPSLALPVEAPVVGKEEVDGSTILAVQAPSEGSPSRRSTYSHSLSPTETTLKGSQARSESPVGAEEDQCQNKVDEHTPILGASWTLGLGVPLT